jgi:hypothetical protein
VLPIALNVPPPSLFGSVGFPFFSPSVVDPGSSPRREIEQLKKWGLTIPSFPDSLSAYDTGQTNVRKTPYGAAAIGHARLCPHE